MKTNLIFDGVMHLVLNFISLVKQRLAFLSILDHFQISYLGGVLLIRIKATLQKVSLTRRRRLFFTSARQLLFLIL
jgi:hypothetical protein